MAKTDKRSSTICLTGMRIQLSVHFDFQQNMITGKQKIGEIKICFWPKNDGKAKNPKAQRFLKKPSHPFLQVFTQPTVTPPLPFVVHSLHRLIDPHRGAMVLLRHSLSALDVTKQLQFSYRRSPKNIIWWLSDEYPFISLYNCMKNADDPVNTTVHRWPKQPRKENSKCWTFGNMTASRCFFLSQMLYTLTLVVYHISPGRT